MITMTAAGHVGRDASTRQAGSTTATGFPLAVNVRRKGDDQTIWLDVTVWGKRGEAIQPHVSKGDAILVSGRFSTREYEGKTYFQLDANEVEFLGSKRKQDGAPSGDDLRQRAEEKGLPDPTGPADNSDIPF